MHQITSNDNYLSKTLDSNYVELKNDGMFSAKVTLICQNNQNNITIQSTAISSKSSHKVYFYPNSTHFSIAVKIFDGVEWNEIYTLNQTSVYILQLTLTGTLSDPLCTITQNTSQMGNGTPSLSLNKVPDPTTAHVDDKVNVTVTINNTGDGTAENVVLDLNIADIAEIIPPDNSETPSSGNGLKLDSIQAGQTVTLSYTVLITTMPAKNPVASAPTLTYQYIDSNNTIVSKTVTGDVTPITINPKACIPCCCNSCCKCN